MNELPREPEAHTFLSARADVPCSHSITTFEEKDSTSAHKECSFKVWENEALGLTKMINTAGQRRDC